MGALPWGSPGGAATSQPQTKKSPKAIGKITTRTNLINRVNKPVAATTGSIPNIKPAASNSGFGLIKAPIIASSATKPRTRGDVASISRILLMDTSCFFPNSRNRQTEKEISSEDFATSKKRADIEWFYLSVRTKCR
jgi:hypothetical protein